MFIPVGDTPNPVRFRPYVNWTLIALNIAVYIFITLPLGRMGVDPSDPRVNEYLRMLAPHLPPSASWREMLASLSAYDLLVMEYGYRPATPEAWDLFTSMFLHGGLMHLAGNMLFLHIFGDNCEHRLGRVRYLAFYLVTGCCATLSFAWLAGASKTPLVGASGAISGVLGYYFLEFPRNRVKVFVALFPFYFDVLLLPGRWVLTFYVIAQNLLPLLLGARSNVAYGAHLGGFVAGLALARMGGVLSGRLGWVRERRSLARDEIDRRDVAIDEGSATTVLDSLRREIEAGHASSALRLVASLSPREIARLSVGECVRVATWLEEAGHPIGAAEILRRSIAAGRGTPTELSRAYLELGLSRLRAGQPTSAYQFLLTALDLEPDAVTEGEIRRALGEIQVYRRPLD